MRQPDSCLFCPDESVSRFGWQIALAAGLWGLCLPKWNPNAKTRDDVDVPSRLRVYGWRTTPDVRLKRFGIGVYVHRATRDNMVWYDDVALSTGYIGPLD